MRVLLAGVPEPTSRALQARAPHVEFVLTRSWAELREMLGAPPWQLIVFGAEIADEQLRGLTAAVRRLPGADAVPMVRLAPAPHPPAEGMTTVEPDELLRGLQPPGEPDPGPERPREPGPAAALAALWQRHRETILKRVELLEEAATALLERRLGAELRGRAAQAAHRLAGSLGTYGIAEGSRLAREVELLLQGDAPLRPGESVRLSEQLVALRREVERGPAAQREAEGPAESRPGVLLVGGAPEMSERLVPALLRAGFQPLLAEGAARAARVADEQRPAAAIVSLPAAELLHAEPLFRRLAERSLPVPTLVVTPAGEPLERQLARRLRVRWHCSAPVDPGEVVRLVREAVTGARAGSGRVLALDDDPVVLDALRADLEAHGLQVYTASDPAGFWEELTAHLPDVVLLDIEMAEHDGVEICRQLRADPRWAALPVMFLTGNRDPETIREVFESGADDFISKPVTGPELLARVRSRIERTRAYRGSAEVDPATGVESRRSAEERLRHALRMAGRHGESFSLALLDVDAPPAARAGAAADLRRLGTALRVAFRDEDVVGRWDERRFVIGMYAAYEDEIRRRIETVVRSLVLSSPPLLLPTSLGTAEFPRHGSEMDTLLGMADGARSTPGADSAPGARESHAPSERVDVAVIDDDRTIATLLLHVLGTAGYSTRWLQDGRSALEALTGPGARLRARAILLDVGLPGLDGISVLRELVRDGVAQSSRVVMLTARSTEREVLQTLELGAFDHVAKPFSIPVLLQKIRRAIG